MGEDVVSLSYERALSARARYRAAHRVDELPMPPHGSGEDTVTDAAVGTGANETDVRTDTALQWSKSIVPDRDLRAASVTIRVSRAECARLRERAAEAGLTISAYLRSCALEAEVLRAEVKKTLAEMKKTAETPSPVAQARKPWLGWIARSFKQ